MFRKYKNFIRGISVTRIGQAGVILTTSAFLSFIFFEMLRLAGVLTNAYIGLITYMLFPSLFILGLMFIPVGWHVYRKRMNATGRELLNRRFSQEELQASGFGSHVFRTIAVFTVINLLFIALAGFRTLKFMDGAEFCGTACHKVMNPEWTTYRQSPHARVACVECHVGEGVEALISSKLSGLRQMIKATLNTYERPVPTPVHNLRPARETCEKCHWPEKFYGNRLKIIHRYDLDEKSTPRYTTLSLKIDSGKGTAKNGIHWHISPETEVRYASVEDKRTEILWVEVRNTKTNTPGKRYINQNYPDAASSGAEKPRIMDCVDCHNRATHIYEDPAFALDERIAKGLADISMPFAKRVMLEAITANYPGKEAAEQGIANHIAGFYRRHYPLVPGAKHAAMDGLIKTSLEVYNRNIHHQMNVEWGTYPSFLSHHKGSGCFRCHNEHLRDSSGGMIDHDCTMCHSMLAYDGRTPFQHLETPNPETPEFHMHHLLRKEFLEQTK